MKKFLHSFSFFVVVILSLLVLESCAMLGLGGGTTPTDQTTEQATDTTQQSTEALNAQDTAASQISETIPIDEGVDTIYTNLEEAEPTVTVAPADTLVELSQPEAVGVVSDFNYDAMQRENEALREENELLKARVSNLEKDISTYEAGRTILNKEPIKSAEPVFRSSETITEPVKSYPTAETKSVVYAGRSTSEEISAYNSSVQLFKQGNYTQAAEQFQSLISGGLKEDLADNANYWLGEANFGQKKYEEALTHFKQVSNFKISEKKDDAQYMIARCYDRLGRTQQAVREYNKLIESYPTSEFVVRARARLR